MRTQRVWTIVFLALAFPTLLGAGRGTSILESKHNLSASGKGDIKSPTETGVCIFCHSSHNASKEGPLWNHETTTPGKFRTYARSSMASRPEQPNGSTKLCLSCHDGTIAVGAVRGLSRPIPMQQVGAAGEIPASRGGHIGTDLSGTHPVSVRYDQRLALSGKHLRWPPIDPENRVRADANGFVQCTSCHDPHGSQSEKYPLWQKATFDQVCQVCHAY
jgi:predicted CXXCH cytochrome family protein